MVLVLSFALFLLSHLPLLHSMPICPENFTCPDLGFFEYPFYDATTDTQCGLVKVNCTGRSLEFGDGRSYEIVTKGGRDSILVYNKTFEQLVDNRSCEVFNNFASPRPLLFYITILPVLTFFKCTKNPSYTKQIDAYFGPSYFSYDECKDHSLHYKYLISNYTVPTNLPPGCEVIWLPMVARDERYTPDPNNTFSLLSPQYSLSFRLTNDCQKCHDSKKGRCVTQKGEFQCVDAKEGGHRKAIVISAVAGFAFAALMIILIYCTSRNRCFCNLRNKTQNDLNVETFLKNHEFLAPKRYSYAEVKKMTNSFRVKLGQGGYGSVYKGTLGNGNLVAVKILKETKGDGQDFINEVASVGRTSHVNIVTLLGFCFEGHQRALIYEFMPNGSLERFIYGRASSSQLGWEKLHQILIGIARGLEYLHRGCNTRILHFDIKPHNILLDEDFCPKISDFGLAKLFPEKRSMISMSHMRGTPGYIAPELFSRQFGGISHKSDVYSYGMMVLEMVGGRKNVEVEVGNTSEIYFPHWIYKKVELDEELGLHGIVSEEENEKARKMIIVGLWCIQTDPSSRPSMTMVLEMLEGKIEPLQMPPKPFLSSPPRSPGCETIETYVYTA